MKKVRSRFIKIVLSIVLTVVCLFSLTGCAGILDGILGGLGGGKKYEADDIKSYYTSQGYDALISSQKALQTSLSGVKNCKSYVVASKAIGGGDYSNISIYIFESEEDCTENFDKLGMHIQEYRQEKLENFGKKGNIAYYGSKDAVDLIAGL